MTFQPLKTLILYANPPFNLIGSLLFLLYILLSLLLTTYLSIHLYRRYMHLPSQTLSDFTHNIKHITPLVLFAIISFFMLSYHMAGFIVSSFRDWRRSKSVWEWDSAAGAGELVFRWMVQSSLFEEFAGDLVRECGGFFWVFGELVGAGSWGVEMVGLASKHKVPSRTLFAYILLGQLLPTSFSRILFFLHLRLPPATGGGLFRQHVRLSWEFMRDTGIEMYELLVVPGANAIGAIIKYIANTQHRFLGWVEWARLKWREGYEKWRGGRGGREEEEDRQEQKDNSCGFGKNDRAQGPSSTDLSRHAYIHSSSTDTISGLDQSKHPKFSIRQRASQAQSSTPSETGENTQQAQKQSRGDTSHTPRSEDRTYNTRPTELLQLLRHWWTTHMSALVPLSPLTLIFLFTLSTLPFLPYTPLFMPAILITRFLLILPFTGVVDLNNAADIQRSLWISRIAVGVIFGLCLVNVGPWGVFWGLCRGGFAERALGWDWVLGLGVGAWLRWEGGGIRGLFGMGDQEGG
ncbi:hypothetical protein P154DRAFT_564655 [Amniculicola lignicola CBS 123094]|uniref:Uncharacterized protein n=1 Tax=Amniculicola lignicola CBS 123094 TaxID=1392246 RepID=A0A6A5WLG9_9PLEO|nr:hypothetical protein P154DRAFT_564655 [Amniculicola lignicola CBS 123094]